MNPNTEDALRRILAAEADSVQVAPDALSVIRRRVARRAHWWQRWMPSGFAMLTFTGGTAVVAAAVVALALATAPPPTTPAPVPPGGSTTPGTLPPTANVPVFYLGTTSLGVRLFREYHVVPVGGPDRAAHAVAAVSTMLATHSPLDPDYSTPWQDATVNSASVDGDTVVVDLHGVRTASPPDATTARMAVQQLVWTATAAAGTTTMRLLLDGQSPPSLWGVAPLSGLLGRAPRTEVEAPIWLIDPQQDAPVGRTFSVYVAGIVTGGTAYLRVVQDGRVLSDRPVQLSVSAPLLGEAHLQLTLSPGTYSVVAYIPGVAGAGDRDADSHQITIR